jgi:urease accessory protein UreF
MNAAEDGDWQALSSWNAWFRASRETSELRAETEQMGGSLAKLASGLDVFDASTLDALETPRRSRCLPRSRLPRAASEIPAQAALTAYVWSWLENQVLAAVSWCRSARSRGNVARRARRNDPGVVATAMATGDDDLSTFARDSRSRARGTKRNTRGCFAHDRRRPGSRHELPRIDEEPSMIALNRCALASAGPLAPARPR